MMIVWLYSSRAPYTHPILGLVSDCYTQTGVRRGTRVLCLIPLNWDSEELGPIPTSATDFV